MIEQFTVYAYSSSLVVILTNTVFNDVESIPLFKSCVKVSDTEKNNCFNERMISHIQRNFNYPEAAAAQNIEGKVWVRFIIGKKGTQNLIGLDFFLT